MLWVITWIRLGSAQNSKHASAQLSVICREERGGLTESLGPSCVTCWFHYGVKSLLLPTPAGLLTMIMKTYCSEMSQSVQLELHYLCVSLRVSAWMCVKKSGRLCAMSGRLCCGWHGLSVAVSPISPLLPAPLAAHMPPDPPALHSWLGRCSCIRWAQAICLDTPALWFRHLLLYASWQAGWLQCQHRLTDRTGSSIMSDWWCKLCCHFAQSILHNYVLDTGVIWQRKILNCNI